MINSIDVLIMLILFVIGITLISIETSWLVGLGIFLMLWGNNISLKSTFKSKYDEF